MGDTIKMRRPPFPPEVEDDPSGCVKRDDRGNAIWQWKDDETLNQALVHPSLSVVDEPGACPPPNARVNIVGGSGGYDPYGTGSYAIAGRAKEQERPRKRDLRELSKWIELKRRMGESTEEK